VSTNRLESSSDGATAAAAFSADLSLITCAAIAAFYASPIASGGRQTA
jgi:hypothetical protein